MAREKETDFAGREYRLYPTDEQAALMREYFGATRLVYNTALEQRSVSYELYGRSPRFVAQAASLREWRADPDYEWLGHTPAQVLQQALRDLDTAFERFFTGVSAYPKFKCKFDRDSFRVPQHVVVRRLSRKWGEARLQGLGWVRFRFHRALGGDVSSATVTFKAGEWHVSFCVKQKKVVPGKHAGPAVGVDRGVASTATLSDGRAATGESWTPEMRETLRRSERRLAKQQRGGKRHTATKRRIAALHARAARRRRDFNHKVSCALARDYALVGFEDLRMRNMTKSARGTVDAPGTGVAQKRGLNRALLEQGLAELARFTEYKCARTGSRFVLVPAAYTSQKCSRCGHIAAGNRESQAAFRCLGCGHSANADVNAAVNIEEAAVQAVSAAGHAVPARGGYQVVDWSDPTKVLGQPRSGETGTSPGEYSLGTAGP